jgi:hypothetical protein
MDKRRLPLCAGGAVVWLRRNITGVKERKCLLTTDHSSLTKYSQADAQNTGSFQL